MVLLSSQSGEEERRSLKPEKPKMPGKQATPMTRANQRSCSALYACGFCGRRASRPAAGRAGGRANGEGMVGAREDAAARAELGGREGEVESGAIAGVGSGEGNGVFVWAVL